MFVVLKTFFPTLTFFMAFKPTVVKYKAQRLIKSTTLKLLNLIYCKIPKSKENTYGRHDLLHGN